MKKIPNIFLDSGNPEDSKIAKKLLGRLDGQTTNPSLIVKNPEIQKYLEQGKKLTQDELFSLYKDIIQEIEKETDGPISVEIYADDETPISQMLKQAENMSEWGKNIYVKFPTIPNAIKSAMDFTENGGKINMTLIFSLEQAFAVYLISKNAIHRPFLSPFIGRWDDRGYDGINLIENINKLYSSVCSEKDYVRVLGASIRTMDHFFACVQNEIDSVTVPLSIIKNWIDCDSIIPAGYVHDNNGKKQIEYEEINTENDFSFYVPSGDAKILTDEGLKKFILDWNSLTI